MAKTALTKLDGSSLELDITDKTPVYDGGNHREVHDNGTIHKVRESMDQIHGRDKPKRGAKGD
jgi:hypothetical protein